MPGKTSGLEAELEALKAELPEYLFKDVYSLENYEIHKLRLSLLHENFEYRDYWKRYREQIQLRKIPDLRQFGIIALEQFRNKPESGHLIKYYSLVLLLDPDVDLQDTPPLRQWRLLRDVFDYKGITPLYDPWAFVPFEEAEALFNSDFQSCERVLKIDLRKKKGQLLDEFKAYIDQQQLRWKVSKGGGNAFIGPKPPDWDMDQTRLRKEAWQHLTVWKLKKDDRAFSAIAQELRITVDAAKKSYYRAYELIQGRPYDPEERRHNLRRVQESEDKSPCDNCQEKPTCDTPCPKLLWIIDQGEKALSEKHVTQEGLDAISDRRSHLEWTTPQDNDSSDK